MNKIINTVVGGRYYVLEQIGKGGFAKVYKVKDLRSGRTYALKQYITSEPANTQRLMEGMEQELNALKGCQHPVLPKIYNIIKENQSFFLIMEFVDGINLKNYITQYGRMKNRILLPIMEQICNGLYYLHSMEPSIVYRDLKPANIMLRDDGRIKLIDFGIAKRYSHEMDAVELAWGSVGFAAPEQAGDRRGYSLYNTDIRSDIFGIGTTMYYLKTGKVYHAQTKRWKMTPGIKKIIQKCTKRDPNLRFQDCIEVLCAMKSLHIK